MLDTKISKRFSGFAKYVVMCTSILVLKQTLRSSRALQMLTYTRERVSKQQPQKDSQHICTNNANH